MKWILSVVWIYFSLMTRDIEHFFMCFSAILYSSVENSLLALYPICLVSWFEDSNQSHTYLKIWDGKFGTMLIFFRSNCNPDIYIMPLEKWVTIVWESCVLFLTKFRQNCIIQLYFLNNSWVCPKDGVWHALTTLIKYLRDDMRPEFRHKWHTHTQPAV